MAEHSVPQPEPEPSAKRIKRQSPLEEKWERLNRRIHANVQYLKDEGMEGRQLLAETLGQTLFTASAEAQARQMNVHECEKLVEGNPDLVQVLESAMESCRYHEILSLSGLTHEDPNTGGEVQCTIESAMSTGTMSVAWKTPYYGKYPEVMLKNINDTHCGGIYLSFAEIIQTSGTGKSHMVHKLASSVSPVYPPGDTQIWKFLCDISSVEDVWNGQTHYALFFTHIGRSVQSIRDRQTFSR
ncbi:hypothetical protein EDC04DRAFT_2771916 [Pisolithus marmoratus]|nr:hypothetical protein EDC04DRAFT_2771916 [Pisolithus marmoratus]